jgi:uncharacterized protein with GYD domain
MPIYMTQVSYTPEAWAALARQPEDRSEAIGGLIEGLGGRLISFYYSFGDYDVVIISEAPDETAIASTLVAAVSAGHIKTIKTTTLLSAEEGMEVLRRAGEITYRGPGAR